MKYSSCKLIWLFGKYLSYSKSSQSLDYTRFTFNFCPIFSMRFPGKSLASNCFPLSTT